MIFSSPSLLKTMKMSRFENYLKEFEPSCTSEEFIASQKKKVQSFLTSPQKRRKFTLIKALSHQKRFLIYQLLNEKPMCTCALAAVLNLSDSTISHHLKILESVGLIIGKNEGYFTRYYTKNSFQTLLNGLSQSFGN